MAARSWGWRSSSFAATRSRATAGPRTQMRGPSRRKPALNASRAGRAPLRKLGRWHGWRDEEALRGVEADRRNPLPGDRVFHPDGGHAKSALVGRRDKRGNEGRHTVIFGEPRNKRASHLHDVRRKILDHTAVAVTGIGDRDPHVVAAHELQHAGWWVG